MSSAGTQSNSNKRTYKAVTALDRLRITEAFDTRSAADAYTLAESLGINKETARSILRKYIKTGGNGDGCVIIGEEIRESQLSIKQ